jgi:transcriptional regulator with XRE-family HTH domain
MIYSPIMGTRFGTLIKNRREERGLMAFEVAAQLHRPASFVSRLETGAFKETPPPNVLADLEAALGISQAEMLNALGYRCGDAPARVPVMEPDRAALLDKLERIRLNDETRVSTLLTILDLWLRQDRDAEYPVEQFMGGEGNNGARPRNGDVAPDQP